MHYWHPEFAGLPHEPRDISTAVGCALTDHAWDDLHLACVECGMVGLPGLHYVLWMQRDQVGMKDPASLLRDELFAHSGVRDNLAILVVDWLL